MKTILKTSFLAIALLVGIVANAQEKPVTFGVKGGVNLSNFSGNGAEGSDAKIGFNVGVTADYALSQELFLLSGLEFTTKGAKYSESGSYGTSKVEIKSTINAMYLQLPVHLGYKINVSEGLNLTVHAGPYVAYGIGGKSKTKVEGNVAGLDLEDLDMGVGDIDLFGSEGMANRFDFGLGLGVGAEFGKIGVGLGYDLGLTNISKDSKEKVRNMNAYLSVGYKF